jgi:hypothetical protein
MQLWLNEGAAMFHSSTLPVLWWMRLYRDQSWKRWDTIPTPWSRAVLQQPIIKSSHPYFVEAGSFFLCVRLSSLPWVRWIKCQHWNSVPVKHRLIPFYLGLCYPSDRSPSDIPTNSPHALTSLPYVPHALILFSSFLLAEARILCLRSKLVRPVHLNSWPYVLYVLKRNNILYDFNSC